MKLENWNKGDNAPAKTRFVKNEIELREKRMKLIADEKEKRLKKDMTVLSILSTAISVIGVIISCSRSRSR